MTANFDASALRQAIRTSEPPHSTICFVRDVSDTHIEVKFRKEGESVWVRLPASEISWAKVLGQVEMATGAYSLVELGLHEHHPQTEIAALEAQVRQLQDESGRCACASTERHAGEQPSRMIAKRLSTEEPDPFPPTNLCPDCSGLTGCAHWRCVLRCFLR
jgi:hypothetical protein